MSMARDHQQALREKKSKPLTPSELYQLSTIYGKNSPLKDMLKENRAKNPLPECFRTFSEGSAYDFVPEGEQQFEIPKKGTRSHYVMKELTPGLLKKMEDLKALAQKEQAKAATKKGRYKDASVKINVATRKSRRIADKNKPPDAPKKNPEAPSPSSAGLHALISDMKGYREQILRYLDRLDRGRMFDGNIANATREELEECYDTIRDFRSTCKASLAELLEATGDGVVYQNVYDEFLNTVGKKLMDWEEELKAWILKKQHPEAPTPMIDKIGETPGLQKDLSSEENFSREELMRNRSSMTLKGPLNFDECVDSDVSAPRNERFIREGEYLLDSAAKRTAKRNTPDHRIRLTVEEEEAARQRYEKELEEVVSSETSQERDVRLKKMADAMDRAMDRYEENLKAAAEAKETNPQLQAPAMEQAFTYGIFSDPEQSQGTSVDQDKTGNTVKEVEVEILGSEPYLAADGLVDRPDQQASDQQEVQGATALPAVVTTQKEPEKARSPVVSQPGTRTGSTGQKSPGEAFEEVQVLTSGGIGNDLERATQEVVNQHLEEGRRRWQEQQRMREQSQQQLKLMQARLEQQRLQQPAITLHDMNEEEREEVKSIILRESQKRNWHPEDAHRLVQRFEKVSKFPAEFIAVEYIQKFRQPMKKTPAINKPTANQATLELVIPPLKEKQNPTENPRSHTSRDPKETEVRKATLQPQGCKLTEEQLRQKAEETQAEVELYGRLEAERVSLADLLFQGKSIEGLNASKRLFENGYLISNARLQEQFDVYTVHKHYADQKEIQEAAAKKQQEKAAKQNLKFSDSVLRRDEDKEQRKDQRSVPTKESSVAVDELNRRSKEPERNPNLDVQMPELGARSKRKPSRTERFSRTDTDLPRQTQDPKTRFAKPQRLNPEREESETTEPGPSLETGAPRPLVNNPTVPPVRQPTFSREQIANMSAADPSFRQFLAELVDRTGPNRESTRGPSQTRTMRETNVPEREQEEESEGPSERESRHSEQQNSERGSRRSDSSHHSRRGGNSDEPYLGGNPPRGPPTGGAGGGGDDPSSGSSSSSDDSDDDFAGFNASVSRASGRDPFKRADKTIRRTPISDVTEFNPDRKHDKIPLRAPEKFYGNKSKPRFEDFYNRFQVYAGEKNAPESEKFQALMDCLGGEAKELLQGYTEVKYQKGMYQKALTLLVEHYGDNRNLKSLLLNRLSGMQPIRKFDVASCHKISAVLDDFELKVRQLCGNDKAAQKFYYESLESHAEKFLCLFPYNDRQKFFDGLAREGKQYNFLTVKDWFRLRYASMAMHRQFERNTQSEDQFQLSLNAVVEEDEDYQDQRASFSRRRSPARSPRLREHHSESTYQSEERRYEVPKPSDGNPSSSAQRPSFPCVYCQDEGHRIWNCTKFQMLSLEKRYEVVKEKRLCYHCLHGGHGINQCRIAPDRRCGVDGCPARHHKLVHKPWNNKTLVSIEEFVEIYEESDRAAEEEEAEFQRCHFSNQIQLYHSVVPADLDPEKADTAHTALLPLESEMISIRQVTCDLVYEGGRKRVVIVLDTGANNTNIEGNLARQLRLPVQRENIKRELNLVQGSQIFRSNYVNFSLCPSGQDGPLIPVGAYTIDDLINDTPVPDWTKAAEKYPYLKNGNPTPPEKGDECLLLVGSDFSKLHRCFEEYGDDIGNGPLTGRGPLGWYFQGRIGRPTYKGAVNFSILKSLFIASRASVDWEPEWLKAERILLNKESESVPVESREEFEQVLEIKGKNFKEKDLAELRSSEPVPLDGDRNQIPAPDSQDQDDSPYPQWGEHRNQIPTAAEIRKQYFNNPRIAETSEDTSEKELSSMEEMLHVKVLSVQSFPEMGTDNKTLTLVTYDTSDAESIDKEELREKIHEEIICAHDEEDRSHTSSLTSSEQPSKILQNIQSDGEVRPEMDNLGYHVIMAMEDRIRNNLKSRNQISEALGSESDLAREFEELKDRLLEEDQKLSEVLQKHWELDAIGLEERIPRTSANQEPTEKQWSPAQRAVDDRMKLVHLGDPRQYMLSIPWKDGEKPNFKCNRSAVRARQEGHVRKLPQEQRDKVNAIFQDYDQKNYIRALEGSEIFDTDSRYLPYFCVCDELKETTPVRVVWDCRAVYYGKSLNSEIMETPNRLQDLGKIFLRLRKNKYTLIADVSEMFLQVLLDPKDRRYHRFIHETRDYEWNRMLFGNVCSPNASQKVFALLCEQFGEGFPEAVETLRNSFYMDDVSDSRTTEEDALKLALELVELLQHASMKIRKFYSNSPLVLRSLPADLLAKQVIIGEEVISVEPGKILGMKYNAGENEDFLSFQGKFKSIREWTNRSTVTIVAPGDWTKRKIAQASASIYDPHGLISPFTVRSKIILQEIWRQPELDWDTRIPPQLCNRWEKWMEQIFAIQDQLKIERWTHFEKGCTYQVHTFCDASEEGMCVAVYVRVKKRNGIFTTLVSAKSRVSPLKAESISRLELVACTMGVRLSYAVREVFPTKPEDTFFWTDSMVCLHWINMAAKVFRAYVSHRVGEIQNFTEPRQWRHIPGKSNPADVGTREIHSVELCNSELWWKGPDFLQRPATEWPKRSILPITEDPEMKPQISKCLEEPDSQSHTSEEEVRRIHFDPEVTVITHISESMWHLKYRVLNDIRRDWSKHEKWQKRANRQKLSKLRLSHHPSKETRDQRRAVLKSLELSAPHIPVKATADNPKGLPVLRGFRVFREPRFSTGMIWNGYLKIQRVMAYVIRAIRIMMKANIVQGKIVPQELAVSRRHLLRLSQKNSFGEEIRLLKEHEGSDNAINLPRKSRIKQFAPFLDQDGILRARTRLEKTEVYGYDLIYPIILDRHDEFAIKIVETAHFQLQHPVGHNAVKAKVQSEYIILGLGTLLCSIKWQCTMCKRLFSKPCDQFEAALPTRRLGETRLKAFTDIGIDYAGPFRVVMGRGQRRKKIYILVMTCMATRAVHLEATGGMDTTDVINALSRFTDVRGVPSSITSDNQTSFQKADQDLVDWYQSLNMELIMSASQRFRERKGVRWYFNPPLAPHFGGVFEIIVKATKRALYATIGHSDLTEEDFRTAVSKITNMLNSRPIQKAGNESDWETLTPNHFLNMPEEAIFPPDLPSGRNELQARLKHQIEVQTHFWKRFQREIIPLLAPRSKWFQRIENVKEGHVVVEVDENSHRGTWKLALISKVFPSSDSFVRKVEITDALGRRFVRPINRLVPLLP